MMTNMPPEAMQGMSPDMMEAMPADAMGGMDQQMMTNMPPEAMQGMSPDMIGAMPPDVIIAGVMGGMDDGGMGALDGALQPDLAQDVPGPMDATADATLTAMDAGAVAGSSPSVGMDEQADAAAHDDIAATEPDDAPVVEDDPLAGMA